MKLFFKRNYATLIVVFLSLSIVVLTTASYFYQLIHVPPHHTFIGMTHYFEDYYYYLDQFYQGAHGGWLTENHMTSEHFPPTPIYMSNIMMGKIGALLGLESFVSYNFFLIVFKFLFVILSYFVICEIFPNNRRYRLLTFLIYLFTNSMPYIDISNHGLVLRHSLSYFRSGNLVDSRFGNVPFSQVSYILFLFSILIVMKVINKLNKYFLEAKMTALETKSILSILAKYNLLLIFPFSALTLNDSLKAAVILFTYIVLLMIYLPRRVELRKKYLQYNSLFILFLTITWLAIAVYIAISVESDPIYRAGEAWDIQQYRLQFQLFSPKDYLITFGGIAFFFIIGLINLLKKRKTLGETVSIIIALGSIGGFLTPYFLNLPIPGFRVLFSATYIFIAAIMLYGFVVIEKQTHLKIMTVFVILYIGINLIGFYPDVAHDLTIPPEPDYHFTYMPDGLYGAFLFLRQQKPSDAIVLASARSSIDLMIPGLSGKRTYTGHFLTTYNSVQKDKENRKFFSGSMSASEAKKFFTDKHISYIIFTKYDGNINYFKFDYPFLKPVFSTDSATVFAY